MYFFFFVCFFSVFSCVDVFDIIRASKLLRYMRTYCCSVPVFFSHSSCSNDMDIACAVRVCVVRVLCACVFVCACLCVCVCVLMRVCVCGRALVYFRTLGWMYRY